jgi:hypothetical protein
LNALTGAYRHALKSLHLVDRNDPEIVAKKIIGVGATGVRDPAQISNLALEQLGIGRPSSVQS